MSRETGNGKRRTWRSKHARVVSRFPIPVSRRLERGYTMIAVVIGMAVMAILIAAVAPSVATIMKREREQELIFRGKQYARAILLFQKRYGRFPNELKEMYENRPRTIRQLWKDPMCNCADWQVINLNSPDASACSGRGGLPGGLGGPGSGVNPRPQPTTTPGVFGPSEGTKTVGPIIGVRSKVHQEALAEWRGQRFYDEWRFCTGDADRDTGGFDPNTLRLPGPPGQPTPRGRP